MISHDQCLKCGITDKQMEAAEVHVANKGKRAIEEIRDKHEVLDRYMPEQDELRGPKTASDARGHLIFEMQKGLAARINKMIGQREKMRKTGYCSAECEASAALIAAALAAESAAANGQGDKPFDDYESLRNFLREYNLIDLLPVLQGERITLYRLVNLRDEFFKELGLKIGDRQALQSAIQNFLAKNPQVITSPQAFLPKKTID